MDYVDTRRRLPFHMFSYTHPYLIDGGNGNAADDEYRKLHKAELSSLSAQTKLMPLRYKEENNSWQCILLKKDIIRRRAKLEKIPSKAD